MVQSATIHAGTPQKLGQFVRLSRAVRAESGWLGELHGDRTAAWCMPFSKSPVGKSLEKLRVWGTELGPAGVEMSSSG
jgi:hypothetical protein